MSNGKETEVTTIPQIRQVFYDLYANFPAANQVNVGDLAYATDSLILYRSNGAAWQAITSAPPLTIAETEVYNAASPIAWTDLDLSATIGAQLSVVFLKIHDTVVGGDWSAFRQNGDVDEQYSADLVGGGICSGTDNQTYWRIIAVLTDAAGLVEWRCETNHIRTIDIVGYIS